MTFLPPPMQTYCLVSLRRSTRKGRGLEVLVNNLWVQGNLENHVIGTFAEETLDPK